MISTYFKVMVYLSEYHLMRVIARLFGWPLSPLPKFSKEQKLTLNQAFKSLLTRWKEIRRQFPDAQVFSSPIAHTYRYKLILQDLRNFLSRKDRRESFDLNGVDFNENCPEYFKRNYHYQTEGYFTENSAHRYDHQIELLFLGTGHIMRKVAYSALANVLKSDEEVLEFGAGSGTSGHQFKQLYPKVSLDVLEPSEAYLEYAKKVYPETFRELIPQFIENFSTSNKYDCIFSCFVMHEIPVKFWDLVTEKLKGSLKEKGYLLIVDSQQNCDKPEHQFALDQFAEDFYEPYFQEFREKSLEQYFEEKGFKLVQKDEVLFSKALLFTLASN